MPPSYRKRSTTGPATASVPVASARAAAAWMAAGRSSVMVRPRPGHQERRLPRAVHQVVHAEGGVLREDLPVRPVADPRPGDAPLDLADDAQFAARGERGERARPGRCRRRRRRCPARRGGTTWRRSCRRGRPRRRGAPTARSRPMRPTPCRPPDAAYDPEPNLPPACSFVKTTSTPVRPVFGSTSTGMPRAVSVTWTEPSGNSRTPISSPCPARASSTELSMISHRQCIRPRESVDPMYMPGRFRTASSPSRTERWRAE